MVFSSQNKSTTELDTNSNNIDMAIDFPNSPNTGDVHSDGGASWRWSGYAWRRIPDPGAKGEPGEKGQKGEIGSTGSQGDKGQKGAPSTVAGAQGQKGEEVIKVQQVLMVIKVKRRTIHSCW